MAASTATKTYTVMRKVRRDRLYLAGEPIELTAEEFKGLPAGQVVLGTPPATPAPAKKS